MIGFIITGHGDFSLGLKSAVDMVAGQQKAFQAVPFEGSQAATFGDDLRAAITAMRAETDGVIVFTDLLGGTPFNQSMLVSQDVDNVEVIAGTNLPMLIELIMTRDFSTASLEEMVEQAVTVGQAAVCHKKLEPVGDDEDVEM